MIVSGSGVRVTGSTSVLGAFTATTKSFLIDHRKFLGKKLIYGVLEGPEHAVYARGKITASNIIILPDEWEWLVDESTITVHLTSINSHQELYVVSVNTTNIVIASNDGIEDINCYYIVHGMRKDVEPLNTVV
jgi:hypothetical protein